MDDLWSSLPRGAVLVCAGILSAGLPSVASASAREQLEDAPATLLGVDALGAPAKVEHKAPTCGPCCHGGQDRPECGPPLVVDPQLETDAVQANDSQTDNSQTDDAQPDDAQTDDAQTDDADANDTQVDDPEPYPVEVAPTCGPCCHGGGPECGPGGEPTPPPLSPKQGCTVVSAEEGRDAGTDTEDGRRDGALLGLAGLALAGAARARRRRREPS